MISSPASSRASFEPITENRPIRSTRLRSFGGRYSAGSKTTRPTQVPSSGSLATLPSEKALHRAAGSSPAGVSVAIPVITTRSKSGNGGAVSRKPGRAQTTLAFAPPKAKLFETATSIGIARCSFGT